LIGGTCGRVLHTAEIVAYMVRPSLSAHSAPVHVRLMTVCPYCYTDHLGPILGGKTFPPPLDTRNVLSYSVGQSILINTT